MARIDRPEQPRPQVVVIGDALIDELVDADQTTRLVGGSALNVAVGLRILGVPSVLIAMIGDDGDGELIREHLAAYGVELLPTITPTGTGVARSERIAGEPRYSFSDSMVARVLAFDQAQRRAVATAAVVAISGFPFDDEDQTRRLTETVSAANGVIAVDPNPRSGLLHDGGAFKAGLESFGELAELLKVGDDDTRLLYGKPVSAVTTDLLRHYSHVLATEGPAGASMNTTTDRHHQPTLVDAETVVDTMGAGDAVFSSALADIYRSSLASADWNGILRRAMRIAAATIAHPGALLRLPG